MHNHGSRTVDPLKLRFTQNGYHRIRQHSHGNQTVDLLKPVLS
jgi:hypothetical protein